MRTALREGKQAELQRLVRARPESVNAKGQDGWTPLMYAALYGNVESATLLLDRGAPVNARNDAGGTALMYAVDDVAKTKLLLERGADPNLRSGEGRTALLIAVANSGSYPVVKLLLDKGADAKVRLPDGRGAMTLALTSLDPQMVQLLLDRGATSPLPLGVAIPMGCPECFDMMLPRTPSPGPQRGTAHRHHPGRPADHRSASETRSASVAHHTAVRSALSHSDSRRYHPDSSQPWSRSAHQDILRPNHSRLRQTSGQR
jgi:hypothetical protein